MKLHLNEIYHVYNRGINRQKIFLEEENYSYFLHKVRKYLVPYCDFMAYVLMPNHFHFLIRANKLTNKKFRRLDLLPPRKPRRKPIVRMTYFQYGLQQLLSGYAKGINQQFHRTGSLFQQNTRLKQTSSEFFTHDYSLKCFVYIHNNPCMSGLVKSPEEYVHSSYQEYLGGRSEPICNLQLTKELLSFDQNDLIDFKKQVISEYDIQKIFR
jgi:REP element-mobilizing transposase RayT